MNSWRQPSTKPWKFPIFDNSSWLFDSSLDSISGKISTNSRKLAPRSDIFIWFLSEIPFGFIWLLQKLLYRQQEILKAMPDYESQSALEKFSLTCSLMDQVVQFDQFDFSILNFNSVKFSKSLLWNHLFVERFTSSPKRSSLVGFGIFSFTHRRVYVTVLFFGFG